MHSAQQSGECVHHIFMANHAEVQWMLSVSMVNYAHYTSKLLQNEAELSGSFSPRISIIVATIWWQVQLEQHGGEDSGAEWFYSPWRECSFVSGFG